MSTAKGQFWSDLFDGHSASLLWKIVFRSTSPTIFYSSCIFLVSVEVFFGCCCFCQRLLSAFKADTCYQVRESFCASLIQSQSDGSIILEIIFEAMNTNAAVESQPREYRLKRAITWQQRYFSVSQTILGITYCFNGFERNRSVRCALSSRLLVLFLSIKRESLIWLLKQINLDSQNSTRQSSIPFFYFLNNVFELLLSMRLLFSFVWTYRIILCVNMLWFIHFTSFYFISFRSSFNLSFFFSNVFGSILSIKIHFYFFPCPIVNNLLKVIVQMDRKKIFTEIRNHFDSIFE